MVIITLPPPRFETPEELKAHKAEFHIDKTYACPRCDKVFSGNYYHRYKRHLLEHENPMSFECISCGFKAKSQESLARHKMNYGPYHDDKCPTCEVSFFNPPGPFL
jgi:transcription elongation factor Elf1